MVGDDGGDGEGAGWWNPRVAEVLLLQVPADAAGVDDAPMEVQPSHDPVVEPSGELHVDVEAGHHRCRKCERSGFLQPLPDSGAVDTVVHREEEEYAAHREDVSSRRAAQEGGYHVPMGSEGSQPPWSLRHEVREGV